MADELKQGDQVKNKKHGEGTVLKTDPKGVVVRFHENKEGDPVGLEIPIKESKLKLIEAEFAAADGYCDCCDQAECICKPGQCHCSTCKKHAGKADHTQAAWFKSPVSKEELQKAEELGKKAHDAGKATLPAQDPELTKMIKPKGEGGSELSDAWRKGWKQADRAHEPIAAAEEGGRDMEEALKSMEEDFGPAENWTDGLFEDFDYWGAFEAGHIFANDPNAQAKIEQLKAGITDQKMFDEVFDSMSFTIPHAFPNFDMFDQDVKAEVKPNEAYFVDVYPEERGDLHEGGERLAAYGFFPVNLDRVMKNFENLTGAAPAKAEAASKTDDEIKKELQKVREQMDKADDSNNHHLKEKLQKKLNDLLAELKKRGISTSSVAVKAEGEEAEAPIYTFTIDMDERGEFRAHVDDPDGNEIMSYSNEHTDEESGETRLGEVELVEDGFLKYAADLEGLANYLREHKLMPENAVLRDGDSATFAGAPVKSWDMNDEEWLEKEMKKEKDKTAPKDSKDKDKQAKSTSALARVIFASGPEDILFTPGDLRILDEDSILRDKGIRANAKAMGLSAAEAEAYKQLIYTMLEDKSEKNDKKVWDFHEKHPAQASVSSALDVEAAKKAGTKKKAAKKNKSDLSPEELKAKMSDIAQKTDTDNDGSGTTLHYDHDPIFVYAHLLSPEQYDKMEVEMDKAKIKGQGYLVYAWNDSSGYEYWKEEGEAGDANYIQISAHLDESKLDKIDLAQLTKDIQAVHSKLSHWGNVDAWASKEYDKQEGREEGVDARVQARLVLMRVTANQLPEDPIDSYLTTALWSSNDESNENGGDPMEDNYSIDDISPEAVAAAKKDWEAFVAKAGPLLDGLDLAQVAHDLWLTRNGHGAGFWDGDYEEGLGDKLTEIAKSMGSVNLYVGDDGKIHSDNEGEAMGANVKASGEDEIYTVAKTYDVITPESAERGDFAESDFVYQAKPMNLVEVLQEINSLGSYENFQPGAESQALYEIDPDMDYETGSETRNALHIDGSPEAMQKLSDILSNENGKNLNTVIRELEASATVQATGEPDQDYDKEGLDAVANALKQAGYEANHKEFDKYQGIYLDVSKGGKKIARFWMDEFYNQGEAEPQNAKFKKAQLVDGQDNTYSANPGDYFMHPDDYVFEDMDLLLVSQDGTSETIHNPKKSDLPKDVDNSVKFKGQPNDVYVFALEDNDNVKAEVVVSPEGEADVSELLGILDGMGPKKPGKKKAKSEAEPAEAGNANAVPKDFPVKPLKPGQQAKDKATCNDCGLSWDDGISTSWTPAPSARCPFEPFHEEIKGKKKAKSEAEPAEAAPEGEEEQPHVKENREKQEAARALFPDTDALEEAVQKIIDWDAQANAVSQYDEESYDGDAKDGQDLELPYWLKDSWDQTLNKMDNSELEELAAMLPALKTWMEEADNAKLSWGESGGMMPYGDANYPDDAVIVSIWGDDSEPEVQLDIAPLADQLGIPKEKVDDFKKWLQLMGHRWISIKDYDGKSDTAWAYSRFQAVIAVYFKLADLMKVAKPLVKKLKDEQKTKAEELLKAIEEGAGQH